MPEHTLYTLSLSLILLGQVVLISFYLPKQILQKAKYVFEHYPHAEYPKLYAVPPEAVKRALRSYWNMNQLVLVAGLALVLVEVYSASEELLNWDSKSVITIYGLAQYLPLMIAASSGFVYFNLKRRADSRSTRKAELRPRRFLDFVSPAYLGLAALVYVAFIAFIVFVNRFEFPWFGGYANIVGVTFMNLFFAGLILVSLQGKPKDPYQAYEDRRRQIKLNVNAMLATSILSTIYIAFTISLQALDHGQLVPLSLSLFFQLLAALNLRVYRIDHVDFEVYREASSSI